METVRANIDEHVPGFDHRVVSDQTELRSVQITMHAVPYFLLGKCGVVDGEVVQSALVVVANIVCTDDEILSVGPGVVRVGGRAAKETVDVQPLPRRGPRHGNVNPLVDGGLLCTRRVLNVTVGG